MDSFIRIVRHPYEEPYHVRLIVTASNGRQRGQLEIYSSASAVTTFAHAVRSFPRAGCKDAPVWELGSETPEDRFAFYFRLRVIQIASTGLCAIEVRFNNNDPPPHREISEFSIQAQPSDLDRFADLMETFGKLEHRVLEWNIVDGKVHDDA